MQWPLKWGKEYCQQAQEGFMASLEVTKKQRVNYRSSKLHMDM